VIGAFVYLRIVLTMYAPHTPEEGGEALPTRRFHVDAGAGISITIAAAGVLFLGLLPNVVLEFARNATQLLAGG
jgi:NADH:ubiquinone oxidoreductase subunit 2 (subunit N)